MNEIIPYSIVFRQGNAGPCAVCSEPVGHGPIGWQHQKGALCDACLIEEHRHLGLALVMVNLVRESGQRPVHDAEDERHLDAIVLSTARLYHRASSKVWPVWRLDSLEELQASLEQQGGSHA